MPLFHVQGWLYQLTRLVPIGEWPSNPAPPPAPYSVTAKIGEGGIGEGGTSQIYQAADAKVNRQVG